jgi:hypothetical protein
MSPRARPVEGEKSGSIVPSDVETPRRPDPSSSAPTPLRQIISNARGRFPQLEMDNLPHSPTKQRRGDNAQHVDAVVERLEGVCHNFLLSTSQNVADTAVSRWVSTK